LFIFCYLFTYYLIFFLLRETMAKQLTATVRFHAKGGQATAAPPVGTALGKYGINLGQFVQQFNERSKPDLGMRIPVVVKVFSDRTFELETKTPHSVDLLKQVAGIVNGSGDVPRVKVGQITTKQLDEVAAKKMKDLNARTPDAARNILAGTARSMGLDIVNS
jgi:large subunit ribosomal protein L11